MKKIVLNLILICLPIYSAFAGTPGNPPKTPIDQYDYTLIIAAVLILAISAAYMMSKKLKKA